MQNNYDIDKILQENNLTEQDIIDKCGITQEELNKWKKEKMIPFQYAIILLKLIKRRQGRRVHPRKSIFEGTLMKIETKLEKRNTSELVKYYNEEEIQNNECPLCNFLLQQIQDIQNTPLNIYGYNKENLKQIMYCNSCKKYIVIYKRKENENGETNIN